VNTLPTIKAHDVQGVNQWIRDLDAAGMLWHFDDGTDDLDMFSPEDRKLAARQLAIAEDICEELPGGVWDCEAWNEI